MIVLQSGETDASTRLPYLQKGILYQLASASVALALSLSTGTMERAFRQSTCLRRTSVFCQQTKR